MAIEDNLAGPTKFLSLCFSLNLFFFFAESSRVMASYLYPAKVEVASSNLAGPTLFPSLGLMLLIKAVIQSLCFRITSVSTTISSR